MDLQTLVAAHMPDRRHPPQMSASAEDRYYREQITMGGTSHRLLASIATIAGVILLLVGVAQA